MALCGKLESELAELAEKDRPEMLQSMDLKEPALNVLTREAHDVAEQVRKVRRAVVYVVGETCPDWLPPHEFLIYQNGLPAPASCRPDLRCRADLS